MIAGMNHKRQCRPDLTSPFSQKTAGPAAVYLYSKNFDASEAKENEKNETNSNALR